MAEEIHEIIMKNQERDIFFVALITILGLAARLSAPLAASFPLNDGGLFHQMIVDLQNNSFALPVFTTYNFTEIPFAYPPFAFYVYGVLSASGIPLLKLMQFLPSLVTAITIPAFYFLAKDILENKKAALFSSMVFALIPRAFDWLIMGGGMTRSLGFLFAILAIHQAYLLFSSPTNRSLILTALFSALVILTHPEATVHTAIAAIFFYFWKDRTIKGAIRASIVALGTVAISSPWWATILSIHGAAPFHAVLTAASGNSIDPILRIFALIKFEFTDEPFMQLISVIGLLGLFILLARRKPALPIWFILIALLEPRGGGLYMMLPLAMFAGATFDQAISPILKPQDENSKAWAWNSFIGFFLLYGLINASITASDINRNLTLTSDDLHALAWVKENTPPESQFILITGGLPLNDTTTEWFPVIAERISLATLFGYEWVDDGNFNARVQEYEKLQACASREISCLNEWTQGKDFSHLFIRRNPKSSNTPSILVEQLKSSPQYQVIYEAGEITIFEKIP